jgi:hypothetical protein
LMGGLLSYSVGTQKDHVPCQCCITPAHVPSLKSELAFL